MIGVEEATVARGKQPWGRPAVGEPRSPDTRRSKADQWRPAAGQLAALDAELASMVGMDRADLLRRIVTVQVEGSFRSRGGPGVRWSRALAPAEDGRVTVIWGRGQAAMLDGMAQVLSDREGGVVTRNEVVRRLVARWMRSRKQ